MLCRQSCAPPQHGAASLPVLGRSTVGLFVRTTCAQLVTLAFYVRSNTYWLDVGYAGCTRAFFAKLPLAWLWLCIFSQVVVCALLGLLISNPAGLRSKDWVKLT